MALLVAATAGCSRAYYRRQADEQTYALVDCAASDPRWPLEGFTIRPDPQSRFFDPDPPDCPPMPPDDPTAQRLMECVDGKRGWPHWHDHGDTPTVENPTWRAYLPYDETGAVVLDRESAVQMALMHSREYQQELEGLYLSALDVTLQRFRFDTQFFGGNSTFYTADGRLRAGDSQSVLNTDTDFQTSRLLAGGGELLVGMANSLVWQFSGPDTYAATTLLDFSLVQPLLRAGGRAVVLEQLTQSERDLLAEIRAMERFRREFYAQIIAGRSGTGLLALLEEQVRIRNQENNVAGLRDSVELLDALFKRPPQQGGKRETRFQVDQARQRLYRSQSSLLSTKQNYQDRLDAYKISLGLPPDLNVRVADDLLQNQKLDLIAEALTETQNEVGLMLGPARELVDRIRAAREAPTAAARAAAAAKIARAAEAAVGVAAKAAEAIEAAETGDRAAAADAAAAAVAAAAVAARAAPEAVEAVASTPAVAAAVAAEADRVAAEAAQVAERAAGAAAEAVRAAKPGQRAKAAWAAAHAAESAAEAARAVKGARGVTAAGAGVRVAEMAAEAVKVAESGSPAEIAETALRVAEATLDAIAAAEAAVEVDEAVDTASEAAGEAAQAAAEAAAAEQGGIADPLGAARAATRAAEAAARAAEAAARAARAAEAAARPRQVIEEKTRVAEAVARAGEAVARASKAVGWATEAATGAAEAAWAAAAAAGADELGDQTTAVEAATKAAQAAARAAANAGGAAEAATEAADLPEASVPAVRAAEAAAAAARAAARSANRGTRAATWAAGSMEIATAAPRATPGARAAAAAADAAEATVRAVAEAERGSYPTAAARAARFAEAARAARAAEALVAAAEIVTEAAESAQAAVLASVPGGLDQAIDDLSGIPEKAGNLLELVETDCRALNETLAKRRQQLADLSKPKEFREGAVDPGLTDVNGLHRRVVELNAELYGKQDPQVQSMADALLGTREDREWFEQLGTEPGLAEQLRATLKALDGFRQDAPKAATAAGDDLEAWHHLLEESRELLYRLSDQLLSLSLRQAQARVDTVMLIPVDLNSSEALEIARTRRRDWMNTRAALVDVWRQIEVAANDLRSGLDVTFQGDLSTTDNNPVRFRGPTGRLQVGLEFDAPLTRLTERNAYRQALIAYQQTRRDYVAFEDQISQSLRSTLRDIRLSQLDFELQRAAVHVAIAQVELARIVLQSSPEPGPTAARDLVDALSALLDTQNSLLGIWVDYQTQRINLDLDLGTMELDARGIWIDPGAVQPTGVNPSELPEEIPPGIEIPPALVLP